MLACMEPRGPTECHGTCNLFAKQMTKSLLTLKKQNRKSFCTEVPTLFFIQKGYHTSPTPLKKRG
ncbi:hypothetical protein IMY05_010G0121500 [Salix suchowensis]|nr:hypothetical protein IMY05_010G0121500 [Salix suchowensis]